MWILLEILLFLAALITVVLLLPVYVIIKSGVQQELVLRYRFLGKTYGEEPDPNNPIILALKKSAGIQRFEKENLQRSVKKGGLSATVKESVQILLDLLEQVLDLLQYCTATRFCLTLVSAGEDPADAALQYGRNCALVYPLVGLISSRLHLPRRGRKIDIRCDMDGGSAEFSYDICIRIRVCYVLKAFLRIAYAEAKRTYEEENPQP